MAKRESRESQSLGCRAALPAGTLPNAAGDGCESQLRVSHVATQNKMAAHSPQPRGYVVCKALDFRSVSSLGVHRAPGLLTAGADHVPRTMYPARKAARSDEDELRIVLIAERGRLHAPEGGGVARRGRCPWWERRGVRIGGTAAPPFRDFRSLSLVDAHAQRHETATISTSGAGARLVGEGVGV